MSDKSMRKSIVVFICMALIVSISARIVWINIHAEHTPIQHYKMGEWVDLSGTYFENLEWENYDGYSLRVESAEILSLEEYRSKYGKGEYASRDIPGIDKSEKNIFVANYDIRNTNNVEGGIQTSSHVLIPGCRNIDYAIDPEIWSISEPEAEEIMGGVALVPNSEYMLHVPFTFVSNPAYFQKYDHEIRMPITDQYFELSICNGPVRKVVDIEV